MGLLGKLFGGSAERKQAVSAREALPMAEEAMRGWSAAQAGEAQLCCVYTSVEDANRDVSRDGRCRAWHLDFWFPKTRTFYLVRVTDGRAKGWERPLGRSPVEYVYALYGNEDAANPYVEPVAAPADWADTPTVAQAAWEVFTATVGKELAPAVLEDYGLRCMCLNAAYLRYRHPSVQPQLLTCALPETPCYAVLITHIDIEDNDSVMVYVDATTGDVAAAERFRFPAYFNYGNSCDW